MDKMAEWQKDLLLMIDDCESRESRCSEWELEFLESIKTRVEQGISLTEKQQETLDKIWDKATKNG